MAGPGLQSGYRTGDVIAAEATPPGRGGVSMVRVSGAGAREVVAGLFSRPLPEPGAFRHGALYRAEGQGDIDDVVVLVYAAPHSYTGEDVVEICSHGSPVVVAEILEALYERGARPAMPGEFTLRAFLNGRLDLTQAEAVADLVAAGSREAARQARRQLSGALSAAAAQVADGVAQVLTWCELELDFSEDDVELAPPAQKLAVLEGVRRGLEEMLRGYQVSRRLREGVRVALAGAPNVGKSSLFNALVGRDRAIVHPAPGTTRDAVSASCVIGGVTFELVDTAGIRAEAGEVEAEGIRRAWEEAQSADVVAVVRAVDLPQTAALDVPRGTTAAVVRVLNKIDLGGEPQPGEVGVSALTGRGMEDLRAALFAAAVGGETPSGCAVTRERHFAAVRRALAAVEAAAESIRSGQPGEMTAEDLREALDALDELTGRRRLETLLENIFARFCIGK